METNYICPYCHNDVYPDQTACNHCGNFIEPVYVRDTVGMVVLAIFVVIFLIIMGCLFLS